MTWTNKAVTVVELVSGERTRLTDADTAALSPVWSPDGQQLAYVAAPDPRADVMGGVQRRRGRGAGRLRSESTTGGYYEQFTQHYGIWKMSRGARVWSE